MHKKIAYKFGVNDYAAFAGNSIGISISMKSFIKFSEALKIGQKIMK